MNKREIFPFGRPFFGDVSVPSSKSITNRFFPLAVLFSKGQAVRITNALQSEDAEVMRDALVEMGANIAKSQKHSLDWDVSDGVFWGKTEDVDIFCGNSGTTIRFLSAIALLRKGKTFFHGIERMNERPIGDLVDSLAQIGAEVLYLGRSGFSPFCIIPPKELYPKRITLNASLSSQFLSAILHILPFLPRGSNLSLEGEIVSRPYIQMTLSILEEFGTSFHNNHFQSFSVLSEDENTLKRREFFVEADASSASYPLALFAITGGEGRVIGIGKKSLQGDALFAERVLKKMGAEVSYSEKSISVSSPQTLLPLGEISLEDMPDVAMTAVILASYAHGYSKISGLSTLRHKECDRIAALAKNLTALGADILEGDDFLEVFGNPRLLHGGEIDSFNDHRVAMCFAVLGSVVPGILIRTPECVEKTYPRFWEDLEKWRNRG